MPLLVESEDAFGYNFSGTQAAALRSFLKPIGLDVSNMAPDPKFIVLEKMAQLSMEYGFPSLVKFSFVRVLTHSKKILDVSSHCIYSCTTRT